MTMSALQLIPVGISRLHMSAEEKWEDFFWYLTQVLSIGSTHSTNHPVSYSHYACYFCTPVTTEQYCSQIRSAK